MSTNNEKSGLDGRIFWSLLIVVVVVAGVAAFLFYNSRVNDAEQSVRDEAQRVSEQASSEVQSSPAPTNGNSPEPTEGGGPQGSGSYGDDPLAGSSENDVTSAAASFAEAFLAEYRSQSDFMSAMRPLTTSSQADRLNTVDYRNIPFLEVNGEASIYSSGTSDALVDVPLTNSSSMRVYMKNQSGWKVDDYGIR